MGLPEGDAEPPPAQLGYLLVWWGELSAARAPGMAGPAPIGYGEIESWSRLTGRRLRPWEVDVLRRVDDAFLRSVSDG